MTKTISIFGSTGSIGKNTVKIVEDNLSKFNIIALVARNNVAEIVRQARSLKPKYVALYDASCYDELKSHNLDCEIICGEKSTLELAKIKCDIFISAISGLDGLLPTIEAIKSGSYVIGMANKECLISAGNIIKKEALKFGSKLLPLDSEHNSIFQLAQNSSFDDVKKVTITASGGPFFSKNIEDFKYITKKEALQHPKWKMGGKITIDSATMMNKALEIAEALAIFPINIDQISAIIHPESIIHAIIEYVDGMNVAAIYNPDMKIPISSALFYPNRMNHDYSKIDFVKIRNLNFYDIDYAKFPSVKLVMEVLKTHPEKMLVVNAANDIAVEEFLNERICFTDIVKIISNLVEKFEVKNIDSIEEVLYFDKLVKKYYNNNYRNK